MESSTDAAANGDSGGGDGLCLRRKQNDKGWPHRGSLNPGPQPWVEEGQPVVEGCRGGAPAGGGSARGR